MKNLELISFPRLAGTKYEEKAFDIIKKKIRENRIKFSFQEFTFTSFYSKYLPKIIFTLLFLLIFSLFLENLILLSFIVCFIMIFSIFIVNPIKIKFGKKKRSQNIYVNYPIARIKEMDSNLGNIYDDLDSRNIFLIAHVDSKGQRFSIKIRIFSYKLWFSSYILALLFIVINHIFIFNFFTYIIEFIFMLINLGAVIFIVLNSTNNKSPGALDNASGIACVLELLKYYSKQEHWLKNFNLWFLFTGAEELGTMGIRYYYDSFMKIDRRKSFFINFDSIGKKVSYFSSSINKKNKKDVYQKFLQIAKDINLKLEFSSSTFGVRSDGLYLKNRNFNGFGFGDPRSFKHIHSVNDTIDKVEANLLKKLCNFIILALNEIDNLS